LIFASFSPAFGADASYRPSAIPSGGARPSEQGPSRLGPALPATWLPLPLLHAQLLPLALAAGHEALLLTCHYQGPADESCYYEADASGGPSGFRRYVSWLDQDGGDRPANFERVLRRKLEQQASLRQAGGAPAAPTA